MSKPKAPKEDPSTIALRRQQVVDLTKLSEEENQRIKQLLVAQRGGRFFRHSPSMRAAPSDKAGSAPGSGGVAATPGSVYSGGSARMTSFRPRSNLL